jgi:hypothetical protein
MGNSTKEPCLSFMSRDTHTKIQATQHGCLPGLMGDGVGFNGIEIEYCEEENILSWAVLRIRDVYPGS